MTGECISMPAYVTTDAGKHWQTYRMPRYTYTPYQPGGDPMLTSDADGRIYYAFLVYDAGLMNSNLQLASSIDGQHWEYTPPVLQGDSSTGIEDKEAIAVDRDPNSPHFGRLYLGWVHYPVSLDNDTIGLKLCFSDDHGATWSVPKFLTQRDCLFNQPIEGHNGMLAITYSEYADSTDFRGTHYVLVSKDGGETFIQQTISTYQDYPKNRDSSDGLKGMFGFRAFPYIASVIDQLTNRIEVVYGDYNASLRVAKLYTAASTDLGASWSRPVSLTNIDATGDVFHPALALDQTSGRSFVSYYSSVSDTNNLLSKIIRTEITTQGLGSATELETVAFDPTQCGAQSQGNPFIGDYTGSDAYSGVYASAWTEGSNQGDGEIFAYVSSPQSGVESGYVASAGAPNVHPWSDPISDKPVTVGFTTSRMGAANLELLNLSGVILRRYSYDALEVGDHTATFDLSRLAAGPYFFRLSADGQVHTERVVHVR